MINSRVQQEMPWVYSFWKFSRPHTIIGTSLSGVGLSLMALANSPHPWFIWQNLAASFGTILACLCGNIYIVGLNQLEDVEIDKINKPHLPIAAGEFSPVQAQQIIITTGVLAVLLALVQGPFLVLTIGISLMIGTAYSLPPMRLKRFPFWAALCIFSVRGFIVNLGLFLHLSWVIQGGKWPIGTGEFWQIFSGVEIPLTVWVLTVFILGFTFAIAIFKDIPDLEGDRQYHIMTLTLKLGAPAVFNLGRWVLTICYLGMMIFSALRLPGVHALFLGVTHLVAMGLMGWESQKVHLQNKASIAEYYQFIWKLFFLEYLIFPMACLP